ncbi:MAG: TonB-dependent receptor domain-containing protein [Gemmatimonadaceae bacterium]
MITGKLLLPALLLPLVSADAHGQGVTTAGVRGSIVTADAARIDARVRITHEGTGYSLELRASGGHYHIQGLEPGGPYTILVRAVGYAPTRQQNVFIKLGQLALMDFVLQPAATQLDAVTIEALQGAHPASAGAHGGTATIIPAAMLDRIPTLNRDLYDFVRLVPQISTKIGLANPGLSGGGVGFRFNNFLINGVTDRTSGGSVSGAFTGAKSIPLDAVQEYQVLLSPYDVRYGDFAGALINAVTKAGTNDFRGSVFGYLRNDRLARSSSETTTPYEKMQYGFTVGGPIVRDRAHFLVASELQHFTYPASGPYVGQPPGSTPAVPVSGADIELLTAILRGYGLDAGSAGPITNRHPLRNLFTRVDFALPRWNSRVVAWHNHAGSEDIAFSRAARDTFALSSSLLNRVAAMRTSAVHIHTALPRDGGGHNEFLISRRVGGLNPVGSSRQPIVRVSLATPAGGSVTVNTGTPDIAQGSGTRAPSISLKDNLTFPLGAAHVLTLGAELETFRIRNGAAPGSYGTWSFASLRDLELGIADRYEVRVRPDNANTPISGNQTAVFASDQWRATETFSITAGLRGDRLAITERAPYHPQVDSIFGRRTDEQPRERLELSPRVGFVWDLSRTRGQQLRGGMGIFATRYPLGWAHTALSTYGVGGLLRCNSAGPSRFPPPFSPDHRAPPTACAGGATITSAFPGDVDLLARDLRIVRVLRGSVAYERRIRGDLLLTSEALLTRGLSDFVVVNLNLADPVGTDAYGRVMYGTIAANGAASPKRRSEFTEAIEIRNTSRNRSYQLSTKLEKMTAGGSGGSVAYTFSRVRDVQTPLRVNTRGTVLWASARVMAGRHDDMSAGVSSNDIPHRLIIFGTYVSPWARARTELSLYYVGESGRPFTFIAFGASTRGDLNADGSNANDPIYVPKDARDGAEIRFSGLGQSAADNSTAAQAAREVAARAAFEDFIERTPCLRTQRGRILDRNRCREPWSNTTIASLRQALPLRGRAVEVQLEIFNVLNLLRSSWGLRREAAPALLEHVGQVSSPPTGSQPVFRFDSARTGWTVVAAESVYQLQLALRYRF